MKRRILALLLVLALAVTMLPAAAAETEEALASGVCGDNLTWTIDADGVLTISGSGAMYDYGEYNIAPWNNEGYSKLVLSDEITHIGSYAFQGGPDYRAYTATLELPSKLKSVGSHAFSGWQKLEKLVIPEGVEYVGDYAFYNVTYITDLDEGQYGTATELYGTLTMPSVWPEMGEYAFANNNFTGRLDVPAGTKHIADYAFAYCLFTAVTLPEGLESIGESAFSMSTPITELGLPDYLPEDVGPSVFSWTAVDPLVIPQTWTVIPNGMFDRSHARTVILPDGLKVIGDYAFGYSEMPSIDLPEGLEHIGRSAFHDCENLTSIDIPDSVTYLGACAFQGTGLTSVPDWPASMATMEDQIYYGCENLTGVATFPKGFETTGNFTYSTSGITSAVIPDGVTTISNYTFCDCKKLVSVHIPASVTTIEGAAFAGSGVKTIIYEGTREDWDAIQLVTTEYGSLEATKTVLQNANIRCLGIKRPQQSNASYNSTTAKRTFWIYDGDNTTYPLPNGYTVTVGEQTYNTGDRHYITIEMDKTEAQDVVISKAGYESYTIPAGQVGSVNTVNLYRADKTQPYAKSVMLDRSNGDFISYTNLLLQQEMIIPKTDKWKNRTMYVDVNWNGHGAGSICLEQAGGKVLSLQEGWNSGLDLSNCFLSGSQIYLVLTAADGTRTEQKVKLGVQVVDPPKVSLDLGSTTSDVATSGQGGQTDVFNGQTLKMDFSKIADGLLPVSFEIREDCTIVGTIGVKGIASGEGETFREALDEALNDLRGKGKSDKMNSLVDDLNKRGGLADAPKSNIGIAFGARILGTFEGYIDEDLKPVLTSVKAAFIFEGEAKYMQSFLVAAAPMYFEAAIKAKLEAALLFRVNAEGKLAPQPEPLTGTLEITVGTGFGHPDVLSGGVEGSGELEIKFWLPYDKNDTSWILSAKAAFVGSIVGAIQTEWVFWRSEQLKLYENGVPFPDGAPWDVWLMTEDLAEGQWVQAPRAYLDAPSEFLANQVSLLEDGSGTADSNVFKSNLYPYNEPQIAVYGRNMDRLVAVWVDDVGEDEKIPENRTRLFYSTCVDGVWSQPMQIFSGRYDRYAEFAPRLQTTEDGNVLLTWLKASERFSGSETMEELCSKMDVWSATMDRYDTYFSSWSQQQLSTAEGMDMSPSLDDAGETGAWLHTPNGPFGADQTIVFNNWPNGTVDLVTGLSGVDTVSISPDGAFVAYSAVTDDVRQVWTVSTADGTQTCLGSGSKPIYAEGKLWWYDSGVIRSDAGDAVPGAVGSDRFQVLTVGGMTAVLTTAKNEAGSWTVYASYNNGGWTQPAPLLETENFLGAVTAAGDETGVIHVMTNRQTLTENYTVEQADLLYHAIAVGAELSAAGAFYDSNTLIPGGTLAATIKVENRGSTPMSMALAKILDGETVLGETVISELPEPGQTGYVQAQCQLPEVLPETLTVVVEPLLETDVNLENNRCVLSLLLQDVSVEEMASNVIDENGTVETMVRVVNRGQTTLSGIAVGLQIGTEDGSAAAGDQTIGTLEPGGVELLRFVSTALLPGDLVYAVARTDSDLENSLSNDRNFTQVRTPFEEPETELQLYATAEDTGESLQVFAGVENNTAQAASGWLCAAVYEDGKLVELAAFTAYELAPGSRLSLEPFSVFENRTVKLMVLNGSYAPVTACQELP